MARSGRRSRSRNLASESGSATADWVAAVRALHFVAGDRPLIVEDPYAVHLISRPARRIVSSRVLRWLFSRILLRKLAPGVAFLLVRARFTDDRVVAAAERGVRQLVILGAGLDTFALRYPELGIEVFEADLPASGVLKRRALADAGLGIPDHLHFVSVDFERDDLQQRLVAAGFAPQEPAFFTWMGVTYYLTREAVRGTLAKLGELAAPGSELTLDYMNTRESLREEDLSLFDANLRFVGRVGEPMQTFYLAETVTGDTGLENEWKVLAHEYPAAQRERYLGDRTDLDQMSPLFRLLHVRRK